MSGRLSIVATPIGCLDDITLRALRVLGECDLILAEDTRHTRTLCAKHGIATPLRSFHAHSSQEKLAKVVSELVGGASYALVSDAGTPLISDPGANLVRAAADAGVEVEAIPGPSAVLAALCVAGLPTRSFRFDGFIARKGKERTEALLRIRDSSTTSVLFESPHRIHATLRDLEEVLGGERELAVCRELTKMHEETLRGNAAEVRAMLADAPKGEITLVVAGHAKILAPDELDVPALVSAWREEGLSTKEMSQRLQQDHAWKRNDAYQAVLDALDES